MVDRRQDIRSPATASAEVIDPPEETISGSHALSKFLGADPEEVAILALVDHPIDFFLAGEGPHLDANRHTDVVGICDDALDRCGIDLAQPDMPGQRVD